MFGDPAEDDTCMLGWLQSDVLTMTRRKQGGAHGPVQVLADDRAVTVHSCHSPMREAQIVKDLLLDAFNRDPELSCHEIVVMMPDIEAYSPFIESVFSLEQTLPYAISDRKKRSESVFLEAFLLILSLKGSRLEKRAVMDLISHAAVMDKFGFETADIPVLEKVIDRIVTIHAADIEKKGRLAPTLLGEGIVPFKEIFLMLKNNGFDGWICIEEASDRGIEGVVNAVNFVKNTWDSITI